MAIQSEITNKMNKAPESEILESDSGIDAKMADKARKMVQQKIKIIQENKKISEKAKSRKADKVLDESTGGNK